MSSSNDSFRMRRAKEVSEEELLRTNVNHHQNASKMLQSDAFQQMAHSHRQRRKVIPVKKEIDVEKSTNHPSSQPTNDLPHRKDNVIPEYEQERRPQRSSSVFDRIGPSMPRNRSNNHLLCQDRLNTYKVKGYNKSSYLEIGVREGMSQI